MPFRYLSYWGEEFHLPHDTTRHAGSREAGLIAFKCVVRYTLL